ncbi:MAG: protein serine/threonine phosphatase [Bacteroidota bacterium]|jgi:tetratricopeptide (TPR) repeat protein|nr:protein serine/threonine phosphatase [Bacteroidota bacterium]
MKKIHSFLFFFFIISVIKLSAQDLVLDSLQKALQKAQSDSAKLKLRHAIGEQAMIFRIGYWDSIRIDAKRLSIKKTEGDALNNMAYIYQNQGNIEKAIEFNKKSLELQSSIGNKEGLAQSYNNIGTILNDQGNIREALEYFHKSLKIREEMNDAPGLATSLNNLGMVYQDQGDTTKALEYFEKSIGYYEKVGDKEGLGYPLSNIGFIYSSNGQNEKALDYYKRSLIVREEAGDLKGIAHCYNNIGSVLDHQGHVQEALEFYKKSYQLLNSIGDKDGISLSTRNIGECYRLQKNLKEALIYAQIASDVSREIGYPENINRAEELLSNIYLDMGQYKQSLEHYKQFVIYRDSTKNEETKKASLKKQLQYEFEKKEEMLSAEQEKRDALNKEELKQQKIITGFSIAGGVLVLIMLALAYRGYRIKRKANDDLYDKNVEIETQKHIVEEKNKEIVDSINYAQRIQHALLAGDKILQENFKEHFVLFKPKDIVSGDFYWATETGNYFYLAVCDSTGHGVPGAFMSLLNISYLNEAITERGIIKPNEILNHVRNRLIESVSIDGAKDGMDGILLCIEKGSGVVTYSAAHNAPMFVKDNSLLKLECDKMPVGHGERTDSFNLYSVQAEKGTTLYLSTDGYADQFGGDKGKKLKSKHLQEKLFEISSKPLNVQKDILNDFIEEWRGDLAQVDDICIVGIRF